MVLFIKSLIRQSGRKEPCEEVQKNEPALIYVVFFFISASPEQSEIPLVKKQQRCGENCQSIRLDWERLNPHVAYTWKVTGYHLSNFHMHHNLELHGKA